MFVFLVCLSVACVTVFLFFPIVSISAFYFLERLVSELSLIHI